MLFRSLGEGLAAGTAVNVPLEPDTGEGPWLEAVRSLVPELAAAFGPDLIVSQHGADSHAWDPLAHLRVTTTAMGEAARLLDAVAHRHAGGRWLATGGGGYDAYRVVPRAWSLVWLAGAHRDVPDATPRGWRERWAAEAARYGQAPMPETFVDPPNAGIPVDDEQAAAGVRSLRTIDLVRELAVPRLLRKARDRGWWDPLATPSRAPAAASQARGPTGTGTASIFATVDSETWARLTLAARVVAPADPADGHALIGSAIRDGARVSAAVDGTLVVGLAVSHSGARAGAGTGELLALGIAPAWRRRGLAGALLGAHVAAADPHEIRQVAMVTVAERDPVEPLDLADRTSIARRLLERAGYRVGPADGDLRTADPSALRAVRSTG